MQIVLDLRGTIPTYVAIATGKVHDVRMLDALPVTEDQRGKEPDMGSGVHLFAGGDCQEEAQHPMSALQFLTNFGGQSVREKVHCTASF